MLRSAISTHIAQCNTNTYCSVVKRLILLNLSRAPLAWSNRWRKNSGMWHHVTCYAVQYQHILHCGQKKLILLNFSHVPCLLAWSKYARKTLACGTLIILLQTQVCTSANKFIPRVYCSDWMCFQTEVSVPSDPQNVPSDPQNGVLTRTRATPGKG